MARAVSQLAPAVEAQVETALPIQVPEGETLLRPVPCTRQISSDHAVAEEARAVTITVAETCIPVAYAERAFQQAVQQALVPVAARHFGSARTLQVDAPATTISGVQLGAGMLTLQVAVRASYGYAYPLTALAHQLAGKPTTVVRHLLQALPGVQAVTISHLPDPARLPRDQGHLRLVVLYVTA